jgi:hypothetical protein
MCAEHPQRYETLRLNSVTPAVVYIVGFASVEPPQRYETLRSNSVTPLVV